MKRFLRQLGRCALSALVAGVCYVALSYWENSRVDFLVVLAIMGLDFVLSLLLCIIAPPLRKWLGHDKKAKDEGESESDV